MRGFLAVFDLDGTLALTDHREHFIKRESKHKDWDAFYDACDRDRPNCALILIYQSMALYGFDVQIWTGRTDRVRDKTLRWLADQGIRSPVMRMRREGDFTPDHELKAMWLEEASRKPLIVFEDRARVVEMWRGHGITCAQVAEGAF